MSLFIASIASGSNGNCYYVGNSTEAVLIDAGISCRQVETRMNRLGLQLKNVKAIFVSHEHSDHITGLTVLAKKWSLPVYITNNTLRSGRLNLENVRSFRCSESISIGGLEIIPFFKFHDASDPHSFVICCNGVKVGVFTDIGKPCARLIDHFSQCHAAFLEANYDEDMLMKGRYPAYLKARIRGGNGHLSNHQALELFRQYRPEFMSHLLLGHLSGNNNCPELVKELFDPHANGTNIVIASRYKESAVYHIQTTAVEPPGVPILATPSRQLQLLF